MNLSALTKSSMGILMVMIFVIPQSFMWLKLPFLGMVLVWMLMEGTRNHWKIRSRAFLHYYLIFCLLTMMWAVIGLVKGNPEIAIVEALRVYVVYMCIFCALAIYVSNLDYEVHVDNIVVAGALGIGAVALYTLLDHLFHLGWLPQSVKNDMFLEVGMHDGYVQMNNVNIGMLTFIAPYLLSRLLLSERNDRQAYLFMGLVVAVASAVLASRRVVLILLLVVPLLTFAIDFLAGQPARRRRRWWGKAYFLLLLAAGAGIWIVTHWGFEFLDGFRARVLSAFNTDPDAPRPLQHAALMAGFSDNYLWGSGFGGITSVVRSDERPWTFELTYSRLLFNAGLIGFGLLMLFFSTYLFLALRKIRQSSHASIQISLLTGFLSISIAAVSNPYLSSFDFLFALSIIPLILNTKVQPHQKPMNEWVRS